jgi:hypothetical protein
MLAGAGLSLKPDGYSYPLWMEKPSTILFSISPPDTGLRLASLLNVEAKGSSQDSLFF